jgi:hypothetical protein
VTSDASAGQFVTLLGEQAAAQRVGRDVVHERALAIDLDHGQPFPVARLELRIAADVDLVERERHLGPHLVEDRAGALAQVAPAGRVEDDRVRYG